jgi:uncharacterized damage-inducible protein DinB
MNDLAAVWRFTRYRLQQALEGLSDAQMSWRPFAEGHNIFEYVYHIAGCEHYWAARLNGDDPAATEFVAMLDRAAKEGFLIEGACPMSGEEMSGVAVRRALEISRNEIEPVYENPTPEQLSLALISPVGDSVSGSEGLTRLAQHAAYHTGQINLLRQHPEFPRD